MIAEIPGSGIPLRPRIVGVIFVIRFEIECRFCGSDGVVARDHLPHRNVVTLSVSALHAIDGEPRLAIEKYRRGVAPALRMVGDGGLCVAALLQPFSHGAPDWGPILVRCESRIRARLVVQSSFLPERRGRPVSPKHPQHVGARAHLVGEVARISFCYVEIVVTKQARTRTPGRRELISPRGQERHVKPRCARLVHNFRHAIKESIVGATRILVRERERDPPPLALSLRRIRPAPRPGLP